MKKLIAFFVCQLFVLVLFAQSFAIGDKVEIYNSGGWYKGNIQEAGSGNYAGYYYVHYDGYNNGQWIKASNIKLVKAGTTATANVAPRNGMYAILSYGSPANPIRLGYFELNGGKYSYYTMAKKLIGTGTYNFDAASKSVRWLSGPLKEAHWGGSFETDRDGKTHKIRLNRVTIGANSID